MLHALTTERPWVKWVALGIGISITSVASAVVMGYALTGAAGVLLGGIAALIGVLKPSKEATSGLRTSATTIVFVSMAELGTKPQPIERSIATEQLYHALELTSSEDLERLRRSTVLLKPGVTVSGLKREDVLAIIREIEQKRLESSHNDAEELLLRFIDKRDTGA